MTDDTAYRAVWLLLHDREFIKAHRTLNPSVFPAGPMRYLADLAVRQWERYRSTVTASVLNQAMEVEYPQMRRMRTNQESVIRVYLDLDATAPDEESLPYAREVCAAWLNQYTLGAYVEKAGAALERGDVDKAREAMSTALAPTATDEENVRLSDFLDRPAAGERGAPIPTGLYDLDKLWDGGVRPGELGLLLGPTNVGKSMVAVSFAVQAFWKNHSTLYYTFELTPDQILRRAVTGILERGQKTLRWPSDGPLPRATWDKELARATAVRKRSKLPTADIDVRTGLMSIQGLIHDVDEYILEYGQPPGLIILDSADELAPARRQQATWEELRDIFTALRGELAQGRQVPVWSTGQAKQEAVDRARISLRHVAGAFAKAQKAHFVLGLAQTGPELEDLEGPFVNIFVLKDTLHGTRGGFLRCQSTFGRGGDGYPGLEVRETHGLPVAMEDDPT
jgi:hypothetical protein